MRNFLIIITSVVLFFSCSKPIPRKPIQHSTTSFYKELLAQNKKLNNRENRYLQYLLSKDDKQYIQSKTGFWYVYEDKIQQEKQQPKTEDVVTIVYTISDIYGNEIYPKQEKTYKVDKEEFIPALQDGVKLMKEGEKVTFVIPSYRGFGVVGDEDKIGVNQPIRSTVTLISIKSEKNENN